MIIVQICLKVADDNLGVSGHLGKQEYKALKQYYIDQHFEIDRFKPRLRRRGSWALFTALLFLPCRTFEAEELCFAFGELSHTSRLKFLGEKVEK